MKHLKPAMALAMTLCACYVAVAIPAKPQKWTATQPDGTVVTLRTVGDEHLHYTLTDDNKLVVRDDNGQYSYASVDDDGVLVSTHVAARNAADRSAADAALAVDASSVRAKLKAAPTRRRIAQKGMGRFTSSFPTTGDVRGLMILVNYADVKFKDDSNYETTMVDYFTNMLNEPGFSEKRGTGSAKDYFSRMSMGNFNLTCDVVGPYTVSQDMKYYGGNDRWGNDLRPAEMVAEACRLADADVDFSDYDNDGDGYCDFVYVIYAGTGESAYNADPNTIWPHSYNLSYTNDQLKLDGVTIDSYACSNEWDDDNSIPDGVGTFVHEFSHVMGLPDIYYTGYDGWLYCTPGDYSVLDEGCYNNYSRTPAAYGAYERNAMGWIDLHVLDKAETVSLQNIEDSNYACIIPTAKENEFFLLENRQKTGWDKYIPYSGMLIWHIDFNQYVFDQNAVNNLEDHQYVDIVEANNNPDNYSYAAMRGWPWPGSTKKTEFTSETTPALKDWSGNAIDMPITDIAMNDGVITFKAKGGSSNAVTDVAVDNAAIAVDGRTLAVTGADGAVEVFDALGVRVASARLSDGNASITLPAVGLYFVRTKNGVTKVVVR
jgi:M6 family metalloprotease-like protein